MLSLVLIACKTCNISDTQTSGMVWIGTFVQTFIVIFAYAVTFEPSFIKDITCVHENVSFMVGPEDPTAVTVGSVTYVTCSQHA